MKASQLLAEAADLLERDGWQQGAYVNPITGCRCAEGAVWKHKVERVPTPALFNPDAFVYRNTSLMGDVPSRELIEVDEAVANAVWQVLGDMGLQSYGKSGALIRYNDTPGRTAVEVTTLLRKASEVATENEKES